MPPTISPALHRLKIITASVRTTNRINALLNVNMLDKKKSIMRAAKSELAEQQEAETQRHSKIEIQFLRRNFNMEHVYKLIERTIEQRMQWDRFSRMYDSWKSSQLAESLAADIRDSVKELNHKRYRIICFLTVAEKLSQSLNIQMKYLMDKRMDNYACYNFEQPTYFIIATVFLVYKD